MAQKLAVAIVHGVCEKVGFSSRDSTDYAGGMARLLWLHFASALGHRGSLSEKLEWGATQLIIDTVHWEPILRREQDELWQKLEANALSDFMGLRQYLFRAIADSIGYHVTEVSTQNRWTYDSIHRCFSQTFARLAQKQQAGEKAPLCVIAHSLGCLISSNYIYDLQIERPSVAIGDSPLERGDTLALYYTLGNPMALWSLRHRHFDRPVAVPSPQFMQFYPNVEGEWINFYDKEDLLSYPLKPLNEAYNRAVSAEKEVEAGNLFEFWNPVSHTNYWEDEQVVRAIASSLAKVWRQVNS